MPDPQATWALILHGGASAVPAEQRSARLAGCLEALEAGRAILAAGGSAIDAAEATVRSLEDDPGFNAGNGSVRNRDGDVELDAAMMDGATLEVGAVAALRGIRHPVSVARLLLRERPILLCGDGALRFATERNAEPALSNTSTSDRPAADTVGCIALDKSGNVAAATSTGGLSGKMPGRIGDSPLPGCGFYADNLLGGVALSGEGERVARAILAARAMQCLETQNPQGAADDAIARVQRLGGEVGVIVMDAIGRIGWAHDTPDFPVAHVTSASPAVAFLRREDDHGR